MLRRRGRAIVSDIVSDEGVSVHLQRDGELWRGCVVGAIREGPFLAAFETAGFFGTAVVERAEEPWRTCC